MFLNIAFESAYLFSESGQTKEMDHPCNVRDLEIWFVDNLCPPSRMNLGV